MCKQPILDPSLAQEWTSQGKQEFDKYRSNIPRTRAAEEQYKALIKDAPDMSRLLDSVKPDGKSIDIKDEKRRAKKQKIIADCHEKMQALKEFAAEEDYWLVMRK